MHLYTMKEKWDKRDSEILAGLNARYYRELINKKQRFERVYVTLRARGWSVLQMFVIIDTPRINSSKIDKLPSSRTLLRLQCTWNFYPCTFWYNGTLITSTKISCHCYGYTKHVYAHLSWASWERTNSLKNENFLVRYFCPSPVYILL